MLATAPGETRIAYPGTSPLADKGAGGVAAAAVRGLRGKMGCSMAMRSVPAVLGIAVLTRGSSGCSSGLAVSGVAACEGVFVPDRTNGSGWSPWELAYPWSPGLADRRERLEAAEDGRCGIVVLGVAVC